MSKVITAHPAVLEYDRVHRSWSRARYSTNRDWWALYYENRTEQIATRFKMTTTELVELWMKWLDEK